MALRLGPGPVFIYESILASRRWQGYATRAAFVLALLGALTVSWISISERVRYAAGPGQSSIREMARLGEMFYYAIATAQVAVVLLAAPAATAGAICQERARGSLTHMLVTDLTDGEIVLGKLAARLAPVFALVFSGLPVLAMVTLLGGIIPETLVTLTLLSLAVATLGCSLALAVSVRAKKTHEVLILVYAVWAVWVFGLPCWFVLAQLGVVPMPWAWFLWWLNPFTVAWAPYAWPEMLGLGELAVFFTAVLGCSAVLVGYAMARLRSEVRSKGARVAGRLSKSVARVMALRPGPKLDANPVLWREWHRNRPSWTTRVVWGLYYLVAAGGTAFILARTGGGNPTALVASLGEFTALHVTFGLFLVSLSAPTALAEERVRAGLDVLLATPLSTASVVWAKWRGSFRNVPALIVVPCFCSILSAVVAEDEITRTVFTIPTAAPGSPGKAPKPVAVPTVVGHIGGRDRVAAAVFPPLFLLAQGAAVTSLGLALAVWVPRVGRAMGICVTCFLMFAIGPLLLAELGLTEWVLRACGQAVSRSINARGELVVTPNTLETSIDTALVSLGSGAAQLMPTQAIVQGQPLGLKVFWAIEAATLTVVVGFAATLYGLALLTFNRQMGRVPERPRRRPPGPDDPVPSPRGVRTWSPMSPRPEREPAGVN